ncbi:MAG: hypothetical protein JWM11_1082 [Planctomycetaceae bacterium]|nr:hypothetical protein [Planctomycetaceae bacterium]
MGIDGLDLKFRLEKAFQIVIDREEMGFVFTTPGIIHDFIWMRLQGIHHAIPCSVDDMYQQINQAVHELPGAQKSFWHSLETLLPAEMRADQWNQLSKILGCPLPLLEMSPGQTYPRFPKGCSTTFELARSLWLSGVFTLPNRRAQFCELRPEGADQWTWESSWSVIQDCIVDCLSVGLDEVTPDARMIDDLGME